MPGTSNLPRALIGALLSLCLTGCPDTTPVDCAPGFARLVEGGECTALPPTCESGVNGSILERCAAEQRQCFQDARGAVCGNCLAGFVEENGACRPVTTCSQLSCSDEGRDCVDAGPHRDATCGACLPGTDALSERCVLRTCDAPPAEGSILEQCAGQRRACVPGATEAACGGCWPGQVEDAGSCRPVRTCEALGCALGNRTCQPSTATTDATCLDCRAGFQQLGGSCVAMRNASCDPDSDQDLTAACAAEHRVCETGATGAACGACAPGYVDDPVTGTCIQPVRCDALSCGGSNRACDDTVSARCTQCLEGFVEDPSTGSCRAVRTCDALVCGDGLECVPAGEHTDAFCRKDCGANAIWGGSRCEPCPPCNAAGEEGRFSSPTAAGACVCKTSPGYFYTVAGDVGTFRCDADEDGWVRESARLALESADPVLRQNARCELRTIDAFELVNEAGQARTFPLSQPLALYETDRNDDAAILSAFWSLKGLPAHGARRLQPRELNRLTKLCHDPRADYNDNGAPDVEEWAGRALSSTMRAEQQAFNTYAYFAELHVGSWIPPTAGGAHGTYRIREKSRASAPAAPADVQTVPLAYPEEDGDSWRTCKVDRDPAWQQQTPAVGMDFAAMFDFVLVWAGMGHHSQFKCVVIDNEPKLPHQRTPGQIQAERLRLNRCGTTQAPVAPGDVNPAAPPVACTLPTATPTAGQAYWAAVPYEDYGPHLANSAYRGGCVNDCIKDLASCPGYDINPAAVSCTHDAADFGRFLRCDAWEVCDGFDNDFNGQIDEGNPGGGVACNSGLPGVCEAGTTVCRNGAIACDQNIQASVEQCNGLDDNCDGSVDENNAGGGGACTVAGQRGVCATSAYVCQGGALTCPQVNQPAEKETCGNGRDDNCNGQVDEGEDQIACTDFYLDEDGDGYHAGLSSKKCLCAPSGRYTVRDASRVDCCDKDAGANPSQTGWFTTRNACGSFDWNCSNVEDKRDSRSATRGCGTACSGFCCADANVGWADAVANCGETRTYYTDGCTGWSVCGQKSESRTQACR